jgi:SWIM zinc finger
VAVCKLANTKDGWLAPSHSGAEKTYRGNLTNQTCTCPDHQEEGHTCKHIFAAEFTFQREAAVVGTVT